MQDKPVLTREALKNGDIERLVYKNQRDQPTMSDSERHTLVRETLETLDEGEDLWVFGYGSLIWNPAIEFAEQRRCIVVGYQRRFCFWTTLSRGSIDKPGLMVGLVDGGCCAGVAFRIDRSNAESEVDILFRREMSSRVYAPTWVKAQCNDSSESFRALTFVVDTENQRYVEGLSQQDMVTTIAEAIGPLGRNDDYLFQLRDNLQKLKLEDRDVNDLADAVIEYKKNR